MDILRKGTYTETMTFRKISRPENQVKLLYFSQCITYDFYDEFSQSFTYSSLYLFQQDHRFKKVVSYNHQNISLFTTSLLLCGYIETCAGHCLNYVKCRGLKFVHHNICGLMYNFTSHKALLYKEVQKLMP